MNGVELAREIKRRRSDIPVLLTSGYSEGVVQDAEAAGVQILPKPYHISELAAALDAAKSNLRLDTKPNARRNPLDARKA
jgi:DNA-binding response OmpR family regulator